MKATELLTKQHKRVHGLFGELKKLNGTARRKVMDQISKELAHHMAIEEGIFYPAVHQLNTKNTQEMIPEAIEEHHVVRLVLAEIPRVDPEDERFEAKMTVLEELIEHHVEEEEKEMFKAAEKLGDDRLRVLGEQMESGALVDDGPRRAGKKSASAPLQQSAHAHSGRKRMKTLVAVLVIVGGLAACNRAPQNAESYAADNSGKNTRDRTDAAVTSGDQSSAKADVTITQAIREAVVADKDLSTNAHNVKIITADGVVTLRGPVGSAAEKATIGATAQRVAGVSRVENELEIASN